MAMTVLSGFENAVDGRDLTAPLPALLLESFSAPLGQGVIFGTAIVFSSAPLGFDPSHAHHAAQRGQKRSGIDAKDAIADLLDPQSDAVAVHRLQGERLLNEHFQCSLDHVPVFCDHAVGSSTR